MATDLDHPETGKPTTEINRLLRRAGARFAPRRNLAASRAFIVRRRRDLRFRVIPFDAFQIVNAAAIVLSVCILLIVLLDPHLVAWQASLPEGLIGFFDVLTDFGKSGWILVGTGVSLIVSMLLDAASLTARRRMRRAVRAIAAGYVFAAVAGSGIATNLIKILFGRARPRLFEDEGSYSFNFGTADSDWASFPSGHATTAMSLGVALALLFPRLRWVLLCLGFWIAASRMFVRAHYPSDVLAGCLLGGTIAWLLARFLAQRRLVFGFDGDGRLVRRRGASGQLI
jgi:membrane-associated phospholipid phosphatase